MLQRIASFVGNRQAEWIMVVSMLGLSVEIIVWPQTLSSSAFRYLISSSSPQWIGIMYLIIVYLRIVALILNGRSSEYGPKARALCALAGAMIWAQMDMALFKLLIEVRSSVPSPGIPIYLALTLSELLTAYRAMTDVRRAGP